MRLARHLGILIETEIGRGSAPADVVEVLLGAVAYTLRRAGHTNIDNIVGELAEFMVQAVSGVSDQ